MGQVTSRIARPFRNFNIENRAAKALEKKQVVAEPAPKHESTRQKLSQFREENPELLETVTTKSEPLHERLKQIYVDSKDAPIEIRSATKAPPLSRAARPDTDLGVMDVDYEVQPGKAELKTILNFIGASQTNPETATAASIAQTHNLDETEVENVLKHFKAFQIYLPPEMYKENKNLKSIVQKQMSAGNVLPASLKLGQGSSKDKASLSEDVSPNKSS